MVKILYVCLGNICRSPMAEALMRDAVLAAGRDGQISIDSAATSSWEKGNPPHPGTRKIVASHNIEMTNMFSRQITTTDFIEFDLIFGMDQQNMNDLKAICPTEQTHKLRLFMDSVSEKQGMDVPDPWYTGDFALTYQLIFEGCQAQLNQLLQNKM